MYHADCYYVRFKNSKSLFGRNLGRNEVLNNSGLPFTDETAVYYSNLNRDLTFPTSNNGDLHHNQQIQQFRSGSIYYNEFDLPLPVDENSENQNKFNKKTGNILKVVFVIFASMLVGVGIVLMSGYTSVQRQSTNSIQYRYLNSEFDNSSLYSKSSQHLIIPFSEYILKTSSLYGIAVSSPSGFTLYQTRSTNLWSINVSSQGKFYWIQVAVLTSKGCAYFVDNHTPSAIFGAGVGEWYSVTNSQSLACSSSVTPSGKHFLGWNKF